MLPSITSDLARVRTTLARLAADEALPLGAREDLQAADRVLRLAERSWARMVPHLVEDNRRLHAVLGELSPLAHSSGEVPPAGAQTLDPEQLATTNEALRSALSRLISATASPPAGPHVTADVTARAAAALRAGLATRPW